MALVKFGIPQGLFVTDARISPQAKREFLTDYPSLALEFIDLDELVAEISSNPVLRALWFDGGKLGSVNARMTFPVIFRRHDRDRPILPLRHSSLRERIFSAIRAEAERRGLSVEVREGRSGRGPFEPYRLPRRLTMEEGFTSDLGVTEVGFRGGVALHEVKALAEALATKLAEVVAGEFEAVTTVVGAAYVTPIEGDQAGMRTVTEMSRVSGVAIGTDVSLEDQWFQPYGAAEWDATCDARVTESEWVRVYNRRLDAATACEVATPPAPHDVLLRQTSRLGWNKSVYALLPKWDEWNRPDVPEPHDQIEWRYEPGRVLCGWFHPLAGGTLLMVPTDHGDEYNSPFSGLDEQAADREMSALRDQVSRLEGVELVDPDRARHMLALVSADPLPRDDDPTLFRTADLLAAFESLATPIDPEARRASVTMAWRIPESEHSSADAVGRTLASALNGTSTTLREDDFSVVTVLVPALPSRLSTPDWLDHVAKEIEAATAAAPPGRATEEYWAHAHDVRFGVDWHQSDKEVVWSTGPKGLTPIKVTREDIEEPDRPLPFAGDDEESHRD